MRGNVDVTALRGQQFGVKIRFNPIQPLGLKHQP
jgi:hypothetical protein